MTVLIRNGHVIDPLTRKDEISDVYINEGKIENVELVIIIIVNLKVE